MMPEEVWTFMALGLILFFTGVLVGYNYRKRNEYETLKEAFTIAIHLLEHADFKNGNTDPGRGRSSCL